MSSSFVGKEQWNQNIFFNLSVLVLRKVFSLTILFSFFPLPWTDIKQVSRAQILLSFLSLFLWRCSNFTGQRYSHGEPSWIQIFHLIEDFIFFRCYFKKIIIDMLFLFA